MKLKRPIRYEELGGATRPAEPTLFDQVEESPKIEPMEAQPTPSMEIQVETETEKVEENYPDLFFTDIGKLKGKAPEWIIEGCIQMGNSLNLLLAFENTGKSFVAVDWGLTYASGATSWHGKKITSVSKNRVVVYLYSESNIEAFMVRILGWLQEHRMKAEDFKGKIVLLNLKDFYKVGDGDIKLTKKNIEKIIKSLKAKGYKQIDLFILDTLNGFEEGEENNNTDCGNFLNNISCMANAFNGNALIIHHAGTDSIGKPVEEIRPRGALSLAGRVDNITTLFRHGNDIQLYNRKNRDIEKGNFYIRSKKITVYSAEPDSHGEYPTTLVFADTPSEEIETEVNKARSEELQTKKNEKSGAKIKTIKDIYQIIKEGLKSGELKSKKEGRGQFSFLKKDMKAYLEKTYTEAEASKMIGNYSNRKCAGTLIGIGMLSTDEDDPTVKTSQVTYTTRNNPLYAASVGDWDFKTDSEIETEFSTENENSTE